MTRGALIEKSAALLECLDDDSLDVLYRIIKKTYERSKDHDRQGSKARGIEAVKNDKRG